MVAANYDAVFHFGNGSLSFNDSTKRVAYQ
jgi:hypothetical protein